MSTLPQQLNPSQVSAIARLFSSSVIRELAARGESNLFSCLVKESSLVEDIDLSASVSHLFDTAYSLLKKTGNRHEYVYKAAIAHKILLGKHTLRSATMLTEFRVGDCRADVVILNGTSTVYEVKSERDKLDRLEAQLSAYIQVFARVNVITGENHLAEVLSTVPPEVGVMLLSRRYQISTIREATDAPGRIVPEVMFDSLRLDESQRILNRLGISCPSVPNTRRYQELRKRFARLTPHEAHSGMVSVLRETRSMLPLAKLVLALPIYLRAAALSTRLRQSDHLRLVSALQTSIEDAMNWA